MPVPRFRNQRIRHAGTTPLCRKCARRLFPLTALVPEGVDRPGAVPPSNCSCLNLVAQSLCSAIRSRTFALPGSCFSAFSCRRPHCCRIVLTALAYLPGSALANTYISDFYGSPTPSPQSSPTILPHILPHTLPATPLRTLHLFLHPSSVSLVLLPTQATGGSN